VIAILPQWLLSGFRVAPIPFIGDWLDAALPRFITEGMNVTFFFGGTSLLIVVGVAMDTVQQVESQLIMRHYDGFMKKTRIRPHTIKFGFSFNFSEFENRYRSMEVSLSLPCHFRGAIGRQNVIASLQHLGTIASGTTTQL